MVNAQKWLDQNYPKDQKKDVTKLDIRGKNLTGELVLTGFSNLTDLDCNDNNLTKLDLSSCEKLKELDCGFNQLTSLDLTGLNDLEKVCCNDNYLTSFDYSFLNPDKLINLNISANNLFKQDLSVFSKFINLKFLWIGNDNKEHLTNNLYNKFFGSLESLQNLTKLTDLHISNTDIDSGLEYLINNIEQIYCSSKERPESKVKTIAEQLIWDNNFDFNEDELGRNYQRKKDWTKLHPTFTKETQKKWENKGFNYEQTKEWIEVGLTAYNSGLANYLTKKNIAPSQYASFTSKNAQEWLDHFYPVEERVTVTILVITDQGLEGILNLTDFINLEQLYCGINKLTNLVLNNCPKLWLLDCPQNELSELGISNNQELKELHCWENKSLTTLNISSNSKLVVLDCSNCNLTNLDISNNQQLTILKCSNNQLAELILPALLQLTDLQCNNNYLTNLQFLNQLNAEQLAELWIRDNNFTSDCTIFSQFINLKKLSIGNWEEEIYNHFTGSLAPLQSLTKLTALNISNTDITSGLEYLPDSLTEFYCSTNYRPTALVKQLSNQLIVCGEPNDDNYAALLKEWKQFERWKKQGFTDQEIKQWIAIGLLLSEDDFATYSKKQGLTPTTPINIKDWLDFYYPSQTRTEVTELDISNRKLVGELNCSDFINLTTLNIANTNITTNLEHLPTSLEIFNCQGTKFEAELQIYSGNNIEKLQFWRKDYLIKQLEAEKQDLQQKNTLFSEQEYQINYLEQRIWELTSLIKSQKEKIISTFLRLFPKKELLQDLITAHLAFKKAEKQELPSREYRKKFTKFYEKLEENVDEKLMDEIDIILKDCEELVNQELELETRLKDKTLRLESQQRQILQITDDQETKRTELEKQKTIHKKQLIRRDTVYDLEIELAKVRGQLNAHEKEIVYHREQVIKSSVQQITIQQGQAIIGNQLGQETSLNYTTTTHHGDVIANEGGIAMTGITNATKDININNPEYQTQIEQPPK